MLYVQPPIKILGVTVYQFIYMYHIYALSLSLAQLPNINNRCHCCTRGMQGYMRILGRRYIFCSLNTMESRLLPLIVRMRVGMGLVIAALVCIDETMHAGLYWLV